MTRGKYAFAVMRCAPHWWRLKSRSLGVRSSERIALEGPNCARAAVLVLALVACAASGRRETSALVDAVDRYRQADNKSKPTQADAVAALPCSTASVCEAKRVCLEAIGPTTRALTLKDEVTARLADIEQKRLAPAAAEAASLPGKLDEATRLLETGRAKMTECERRLADLRIEYGG
jgi:hypothetical protein